MKTFVKHIIKIAVMLTISAYALDLFYTNIFKEASPRTKFQNLRALKNQTVDYVFLGSSRVENGVSPKIIENTTGKTTVNLGFQASKIADIYLILQLLDEYHINYKKAFIQIDYIYNIENGFSNVLAYEMLPFINENQLIANHSQRNGQSNYWCNRYVPFYRYSITSQKIGLREIIMNMLKKPTSITKNKGFDPLSGQFSGGNYSLPKNIISENKYFDLIQDYSLNNKKDVTFFIAPFRISDNDFSFVQKLKTKVKGLKDFSNALPNNKYFQNNSHLNQVGAEAFTYILIDKLKL